MKRSKKFTPRFKKLINWIKVLDFVDKEFVIIRGLFTFAVVIFVSSKKIYKCCIKFGQMREYARRVGKFGRDATGKKSTHL